MYHPVEEIAIWIFSLGIDEASWVRRVEIWYILAQLPFFAMACGACFYWGSLKRDTDALSRLIVRLHATRRRAMMFSLVYLLSALPLAGAAMVEHAAYYAPRVQVHYDKAAEEGRLPKDSAPTSGGIKVATRGEYLRVFHFATPFIALPCAILGQIFWWSGHQRLRRFQNE